MTTKDYELIAGAIELGIAGNTIEQGGDIWAIVQNVAMALEKDNPRFDRNKFLQACGIKIGTPWGHLKGQLDTVLD